MSRLLGELRVERRRMRVGRATIAYQVAGAGPPLILVHGLSGSARWWDKNLPALARHFQVHIVDLIGFGASGWGQAFELREAASWLAAWLGQLELERPSLVGHSMGGFICAELAADLPALVERLVLVDAAILLHRGRVLGRAPGLLRSLWYTPLGFLPVIAADSLRAGPRNLLAAARDLHALDLSPKLERVRAPALIVWGAGDSLVPLALGRELHAALPGSRMAIIHGAGHNPMVERPAAFNQLVLDFLLGVIR